MSKHPELGREAGATRGLGPQGVRGFGVSGPYDLLRIDGARGTAYDAGMRPPAKQHVTFRLDAATQARIDALMPLLSQPHRRATRSDVIRLLIATGLPVLEAAQRRPRT